MNISINKMKMVIEELQDAEMSYKRQLSAFEKVYREYQGIDKEGTDKRALRHISEDLNNEYRSLKKLREVLEESVREYENTEKKILSKYSGAAGNRHIIKAIEIEEVRRILHQYNIKFK